MADEPGFLIEVASPGGPRLEASSERVIEGGTKNLDAASHVAREAATRFGPLFKGPGAPDEGSVEFGISFEAESGIPVFAKGKVGATLTVTLTWKGDKQA